MELKYGFVSVDDHVLEHPGVWTQRLSKNLWGSRIPHLEPQPDGTERWFVDGRKVPMPSIGPVGATMADRTQEPQRWEDVPKVTYVPTERLKAMDADGVDCSVLYPAVAGHAGETFGRLTDAGLELACVQAYNDWLIEEWAGVSERFIPQCIVPISSVEATVNEINRCVTKGHKGVVYPALPMELRKTPHINEPEYDPIWATCQDLEVPLCFHPGSFTRTQLPPYDGFSGKLASAFRGMTRPASLTFVVVNMLFSRILLRFPKLKVVFAESALGWGEYLLAYADFQFGQDRLPTEGYPLKPSEMFSRQCYLTGWYDKTALQTLRYLTPESILWATNFPLTTSTWPNTHNFLALCFQHVPQLMRDHILRHNAVKLYRI